MDEASLGALLASTLRLATPLVLCALAGLFSERSGVVDIGLEGKMLFAAFAAGAVGAVSGSTSVALLAAMGVAVLLSWMHGLACVSYPGDQVVSGVAINIIAAGLTAVLGIAWFHQGGQTPPVSDAVRIQAVFPSMADSALFGHNALVYLSLALVPVVWWGVYRTRFGLRLRAVGENPAMVDAAGISVAGLRWRAVLLAGVLCGIGGAFLTLAQNASFTPGMSAGRGFMALAAMVFGHWHPVRALGACLLFGLLDAVAIRLQGVVIPGLGAVPVELIQALPYLFTVVLLAGFLGRAEAPRALGRPFSKAR